MTCTWMTLNYQRSLLNSNLKCHRRKLNQNLLMMILAISLPLTSVNMQKILLSKRNPLLNHSLNLNLKGQLIPLQIVIHRNRCVLLQITMEVMVADKEIEIPMAIEETVILLVMVITLMEEGKELIIQILAASILNLVQRIVTYVRKPKKI